ncbi:hypothetical protein HYPSUDRAFT_205013 [Hypholoma sublateritium FD-334 SS-4]|uniref:Uncharacterized protein n=1 Tax=Hypholoma sublateritium (strain FD-334 SS-4) TaxID=945553 RepID=A0A0D2NJ58_HYPSF|nr:hypothetical protein HYPSUDRAFT_205013 [Hypholoma sublateritium FD-334 SS-4]
MHAPVRCGAAPRRPAGRPACILHAPVAAARTPPGSLGPSVISNAPAPSGRYEQPPVQRAMSCAVPSAYRALRAHQRALPAPTPGPLPSPPIPVADRHSISAEQAPPAVYSVLAVGLRGARIGKGRVGGEARGKA